MTYILKGWRQNRRSYGRAYLGYAMWLLIGVSAITIVLRTNEVLELAIRTVKF